MIKICVLYFIFPFLLFDDYYRTDIVR